jgi:hypothetical protein
MTFLRSPRAAHLGRVLVTLLLAWAAAWLCVRWHTPIPWMIGPLLATAAVSLAGAPTASASQLRNGGQWVIGTALGLYFTPQVGALVASLWWAVALGIAWALWLGVAFGRWLQRVPVPAREGMSPQAWRATTYYAGAIGAASEMTLLAERAGARSDLVAAAHSLRVLMVTLALPFAMSWSGVSGVDVAPPPLRPVSGMGLLLLGGLTLLGILLMRRTGRANPWFMGALLVTMGLTLAGVGLSAIPQALSNTAQLVIGVSLGVRFRPAFLHTAPRWLGAVGRHGPAPGDAGAGHLAGGHRRDGDHRQGVGLGGGRGDGLPGLPPGGGAGARGARLPPLGQCMTTGIWARVA